MLRKSHLLYILIRICICNSWLNGSWSVRLAKLWMFCDKFVFCAHIYIYIYIYIYIDLSRYIDIDEVYPYFHVSNFTQYPCTSLSQRLTLSTIAVLPIKYLHEYVLRSEIMMQSLPVMIHPWWLISVVGKYQTNGFVKPISLLTTTLVTVVGALVWIFNDASKSFLRKKGFVDKTV